MLGKLSNRAEIAPGDYDGLGPVTRVDGHVLARKIARPHRRVARPRAHIYNNRHIFREHFLVRDPFRKWVFASAFAYEKPASLISTRS